MSELTEKYKNCSNEVLQIKAKLLELQREKDAYTKIAYELAERIEELIHIRAALDKESQIDREKIKEVNMQFFEAQNKLYEEIKARRQQSKTDEEDTQYIRLSGQAAKLGIQWQTL